MSEERCPRRESTDPLVLGRVCRDFYSHPHRWHSAEPHSPVAPAPVDGDLIEATAAAVRKAIWEHSGEDGEFHAFLARAAVEVVLDRVVKAIDSDVKAIERTEEYPANEYLRGMHTGLKAAAALAALGSLGKEGTDGE